MAAKKGRIHHRPPQKTWLGGGWHINFGGRTGMQGESHDAGGRSMIPYRGMSTGIPVRLRAHTASCCGLSTSQYNHTYLPIDCWSRYLPEPHDGLIHAGAHF